MTRDAFLAALAWQLTLAGVPYVRPDLEAFIDAVWPLAEEQPDMGEWTDTFGARLAHQRLGVAVEGLHERAKSQDCRSIFFNT
jgi:hypothetical protein